MKYFAVVINYTLFRVPVCNVDVWPKTRIPANYSFARHCQRVIDLDTADVLICCDGFRGKDYATAIVGNFAPILSKTQIQDLIHAN
jgi:hypothetical protein